MKRPKARVFSALGVAAVFCTAAISGCASQPPRQVGVCAVGGAALGAVLGTGAGFAVSVYTKGGHITMPRQEQAATDSTAGAAIGALIGAVAGHYACDPIIQAPPPPPPPPASPPPPPPPPPVEHHQKIVLRGVHFEFNKYNIRGGDAAILDEAADTLKQNPNVTVDVDGYCDAIGSEEYNLKLSQKRADAVADYLEREGIPASQLVARGFGKTNFVAPNDTPEGRAQNRRVELNPVQ